jgi:hypothetical protein
MALELENLDSASREFMLAELDQDERNSSLYFSERLSPAGVAAYPELLREAIAQGDDRTFEVAIDEPGLFNATETYMRLGKPVTAKISQRARQTLAEGEFNRFFIRGLCALVCSQGGGEVEIYRARESSQARPESEALIGTKVDAAELLDDLRANIGRPPTLLPFVNSGLSVRLPR